VVMNSDIHNAHYCYFWHSYKLVALFKLET